MRRLAVGVSGFVLAALLLGGIAAGIGAAQTADSGTNSSFGADVSSFMQASEAEAESEVDGVMFETAMNRTEDPDERRALVEQREQRLEERHQELRSQRGALDGGPNVRARALAARVAVGASELERSVNETAEMAAKAGVEAQGLGALRSNARELRDPDVEALTPAIARQPGVARGPPEGVGPGNGPAANRPGGDASRPADPAANRSNGGNARGVNRSDLPQGQAGKNGTGPANGSQRGPQSGAGGSNGNGNGASGAGGPPPDNSDSGGQSGEGGDGRSDTGNGGGNGNNGNQESGSSGNNNDNNDNQESGSSGNNNDNNGNGSQGSGSSNESGAPENAGRSDNSGSDAHGANGSGPERPFEP